MTARRRVVVVTGGGGGIGAAIAESVSRTGAFVVTVDPLVSVDGSQKLPQPEQSTADRIVAAGGAARGSAVSVTDAPGVAELFAELADEFDGLDAVINVAGISRPTGFATGSEQDWLDVLSVHLDGYRNVLAAALPLMAAAGRGHILGVTSGSGWRAADSGAYGCAKRAVASLTWQLGRHAPDGVVVNAISPIAATRMVTAALARTQGGDTPSTGGLSLGSMPQAGDLGPIGAHLVGESFASCHGRVLFLGGSEVAVIDEPRLIEVVQGDETTALGPLLEVATSVALAPAEANQVSGGGSNARLGSAFEASPTTEHPVPQAQSCAVAGRPDVVEAIAHSLATRGVTTHRVDSPAALAEAGVLDAVVVAPEGLGSSASPKSGWTQVLDEHTGIAAAIHADAQWARAATDLAARTGRPIRLVTISDATTGGGRSRAQASAQLARAGRQATGDLVTPFAVSAESGDIPAELVAHLVCSGEAASLAGAELVCGTGWFGLRSHPRPIGSISFDGPEVPRWFDETLREVVQPR